MNDVKPSTGALRMRNMSGGSTGSLGSLEAEVPETNTLGMSWGNDVVTATLRTDVTGTRTSPQSVSDSSSCDSASSGQKSVVNPTRYKTETCRPFNETGYCKYGEKCQFAHGAHELRAMPRHPKYKTELCRTFHTVGFCPYGPRCHFVHNEDESKLHEISAMKQQYAQQQAVQELAAQAAKFQALLKQASVDGQLKALLAQGQTSILQRAPLLAQMAVQGLTSPQQQQQQNVAAAAPMQQAPMAPEQFNHWMSVPPPPPAALIRSNTLSSTGDSPTTSASTSPVSSPNMPWMEESAADASSTRAYSSAFPFDVPSSPAAQYKLRSPGRHSSGAMSMSELARSLEGVALHCTSTVGGIVRQPATLAVSAKPAAPAMDPTRRHYDTPPSSPESGSTSSVGRSMRLPVFSRLASAE